MPPGAWAAAIWLLACLARDSSEALTTFGKTSSNNPLPPKATPPPGRECNVEMDCAGIQDTSCVRHPSDSKLRCLCGDNDSPINGKCESKMKGLRHGCETNGNCMEGMICIKPNATKADANKKMPTHKMCLCNEEDGYVDREYYCSDGMKHNSVISLLFLMTIGVSWLWRDLYNL
ncbi:oogenesis-related protein sosie [Arctopsyche grandis]|uniref:oogenesis-related protein sosie n=1 Tax=Arctopsyche grandis TaxID=121162 RepID=UPI00406D789D